VLNFVKEALDETALAIEREIAFVVTLAVSLGRDNRSKYPPAKPGALCCEPLKAAIGVAGAPPMCGPPAARGYPTRPGFGLRRSSEYNFVLDT